MSTAVTPNLNPVLERMYGRQMATADEFLQEKLNPELRRRPDSQTAIHLSWTELTLLLSDYGNFLCKRIWK